jgi:threonine aldolase
VNEIDGLSVNLDAVQSNIVFIGTEKGKTQEVIGALSEQGVEILEIDDSTVRAVFHLHITDNDVEKAIEAFTQI